jgi:hypothetical protein
MSIPTSTPPRQSGRLADHAAAEPNPEAGESPARLSPSRASLAAARQISEAAAPQDSTESSNADGESPEARAEDEGGPEANGGRGQGSAD